MLLSLPRLIRTYDLRPTGVLHLGAHLGEEADVYAACGLRDVVWVEGNPELVPALRERVEPRGHRVVQALVSSSDADSVQFNVTNNGESSSILDLGTHRVHHPQVQVTETIELPTTTVDHLADEHGFAGLDFLNIDLQGAELLALRGATRTLDGVRYVYSEVNREPVYEGCALVGELDVFLGERGFERVVTKWTSAQWGDALYVRGGVSTARRVLGELRSRTGLLRPSRNGS